VPSKRRTHGAPARSPEQRLRALAKANEVRSSRAQLKRDLAAGVVELARVLANPPACARTARVVELLVAVHGIGPARANRALVHRRHKNNRRPQQPPTSRTDRPAPTLKRSRA